MIPSMEEFSPLHLLSKTNPAKTAVVNLDSLPLEEITYGALVERVKQRTRNFQRAEKKIEILLPDNPVDFAVSLLAAWEAGKNVFVADSEIPEVGKKNEASLPSESRLILLTSGSTGTPKGVVLSDENILWSAKTIANLLHYDNESKHLILLRLFHVDAILCQLVPVLFTGGTALISSKRDPEKIGHFLGENNFTHLYLAPSIWISLLSANAIPSSCSDTVKMALSTTSPISEPVLRKITDTFPKAKVWNLYGLSESTSSISAECFDSDHPVNSSVGTPLSGSHVTTTPEGELGFKGPNLFLGYITENGFERPKLTKDGYWLTGDLAEIREGKVFLVGRSKEMISVGGYKVFPQEIERCLLNLDLIEGCLVVPQPDIILGERLVAIVQPKKKANADELKMICIKALQKFLPDWKIPQTFFVVDSIPLNSVGKPDRIQAAKWVTANAKKR